MVLTYKKMLYEGDAAELSDEDPEAITEAASASAGVATKASRDDHVHASPATWAPTAHASAHKNGGGDELLLSDLGEPTADVEFNSQEANDFVLENATSKAAGVKGQLYLDTDDDHVYVCTETGP